MTNSTACHVGALSRWTVVEAPNNLPAQLTVGRAQVLHDLVRDLSDPASSTRLITLTGVGRVGKTRLAQQAARALTLKPRAPDGAWVAELAPLTDGRRLAQATAAVFGLYEETGRTYADVLRPRRLVLLFDNCEFCSDGQRGLRPGPAADLTEPACPLHRP